MTVDTVRAGGGERASITLWMLGLACALLPLGGLALDLGRAYSERRALAAAADAAALAGAGALDVDAYRADGSVLLDPDLAEVRARRSLAEQLDRASFVAARVQADSSAVTVEVEGRVDLTLLRLVRGSEPFVVRVSATARPHLGP